MQYQIPEKLLDLVDQAGVTDIFLAENSTLVDSGTGVVATSNFVLSEPELSSLARELIELGGRRLDQSCPFADVNLPGGIRVHAVLASACSSSTLISIRLQNQNPLKLDDFLSGSICSRRDAQLLKEIASSGESFLIAGPTGSGKTTLLTSMLDCSKERVIAIEDVTEITGPNIFNLQSRPRNIEGAGEISLTDLVVQSLRMRPDRIVVGEVRGTELLAMLQALNTGHRGATTIHANSLEQVPERLLAIASMTALSDLSLSRLTVSAFDWVISLGFENGNRSVLGIGKFEINPDGLRVIRNSYERKLALA